MIIGTPTVVDPVRPAFFEAVEKWANLDFGADLKAFLDDICYTDLFSYAQLIHHKDSILRALLRSLASPDSNVSLPALFDFCSTLAQDLREDFAPHFWPIFDAIANVFLAAEKGQRREEAEVEAGLGAMGRMAEAHFQLVSTQLKTLFSKRLLPLLAFSGDARVRSSAARSFAFLLRRLPLPLCSKLAKFLFLKCAADQRGHLRDGISALLFNALIGGGGGGGKRFDVRAGELLDAMIEPTVSGGGMDEELVRTVAVPLVSDVLRACLSHSDRASSALITSKLLDRLERAKTVEEGTALVGWLLPWIRERKGAMFTEGARVLELVQRVDDDDEEGAMVQSELFEQYLELVSAMVLAPPPSPSSVSSPPSFQSAILAVLSKFDSSSSSSSASFHLHHLPSLLAFFLRLRPLPLFLPWCMGLIGQLATSLLQSADQSASDPDQLLLLRRQLLSFYHQILSDHFPSDLESMPENRPEPLFDLQNHRAIRELVVNVLKQPSGYPDDFFDMALTVWPWLWHTGEVPEALGEVSAFVVDTVRKGQQRLSEGEAKRLWTAARATLLLRKRKRKGVGE